MCRQLVRLCMEFFLKYLFPSNHKNNLNQNEPKNNPPRKIETASGKMTKEEAEQRLSVLTEDLKQFQRKQALEMKSLFTYQGNDW